MSEGMTPEQLAERRKLILEIAQRVKAGEVRYPPKRKPLPKAPKEPKERAPRVRVKVDPHRRRVVVEWIPVGTWISWRGRAKGDRIHTAEILAQVPAGEPLPKEFIFTSHARRSTDVAKIPRYILGHMHIDCLERRVMVVATHGEVRTRLVEIHENPPLNTYRLPEPLPNKTKVLWHTQGGGCPVTKFGKIVAYIPAGESIAAMGFSSAIRGETGHIHDISMRDRYLVALPRKGRQGQKWAFPHAYQIEQEIIRQLSEQESA